MARPTLLIPVLLALIGCASQVMTSPDFPDAGWRHEDGLDADYLLAPGDTVEITVYSAPELSRTVAVAPDGRIRMPLAGAVPAAARTTEEVRTLLVAAYEGELREPDLDVMVTGFDSQRIFVGGEVAGPGLFDLPGQIDPLQAVILAGGFTEEARRGEVLLMRRLPGGDVRSAKVDLKAGLRDPALAGWLPLRRFDVIYVPRSAIAEQNLFVRQYIRQALPIEFQLFYDVSPDNN